MTGYAPLADTGNYPGRDEIAQGAALIGPLLADTESRKFIERFNLVRSDLLDFADRFQELEHFYAHQRPNWEKLRKAALAFQLNKLELGQDFQAGPALGRMQEILAAKSPYGLIKECEPLIAAVDKVNALLLAGRRHQAFAKIDAQVAALNKDLEDAQADAVLRAACLGPLDALRRQVQTVDSLAHITQAEVEAVNSHDLAVGHIEDFVGLLTEQTKPSEAEQPRPGGFDKGPSKATSAVKKQRVVKPADIIKSNYLESFEDVNRFLAALRQELEKAIENNERIQIR